MSDIEYFYPIFARLEPKTPWAGGRMADTDVLTLTDAASIATKHAGETVTIGDFLRAAARGEIMLRAIVHSMARVEKHDGGIYCNKGQENENIVPAGAIATLPLTACKQLSAAGRASWRTFDSFEMKQGILMRYTIAALIPEEPDFETIPDDCRVTAYDVHALADVFCEPAPEKTTPDTKKRWTPEFLAVVRAYRDKHTEKETAVKFGVSGSLIRSKLAPEKPKASPFSGLVKGKK